MKCGTKIVVASQQARFDAEIAWRGTKESIMAMHRLNITKQKKVRIDKEQLGGLLQV